LVPGSICVMPEWKEELPGISSCYGICTDYAELFQNYEEMWFRNETALLEGKLMVDPNIEKHKEDPARCVALFTNYDNFIPSSHLEPLQRELESKFPTQNCYTWQGPWNFLHFTFMQVS
jgi:hypothetical protein